MQMTSTSPATPHPTILGEISPPDERVVRPNDPKQMLERQERLAIRRAWENDANVDRGLRKMFAKPLLVLLFVVVLANIGLIAADGVGIVNMKPAFYQFGVPGLSAMAGIILVVIKYLFDRWAHETLNKMMQELVTKIPADHHGAT
jgi:hypothetical protein